MLDKFFEYLEIDESVPQGLRWKVDRSNKVKAGSPAGGKQSDGYYQTQVDGVKYKNHRLIWLLETGEWPEDKIDHINRIRNDNRVENLRVVTNRGNHENRTNQSEFGVGLTQYLSHSKYPIWKIQIRTYWGLFHFTKSCKKATLEKMQKINSWVRNTIKHTPKASHMGLKAGCEYLSNQVD